MNLINLRGIRNLVVFVVSAFALAILSLSIPPAWSQEEYKIGAVLPLTGRFALIGQPQKNALKMIEEEINGHGGINGRRLKLIILDTKGNVEGAITAVNKLIDKNGLVAIIGPSRTSTTQAVVDIVAKKKIPLITLAEGVEIDASKRWQKWVFQTAPTYSLRIQAGLESMKSQKISQFVFSGSAPIINPLKPLVSRVAGDLVLKMVGDLSYELKAESQPIISQLQQKASGKAVLFFDPSLPLRAPQFMSDVRKWGQTAPNQRPSSFYFLDGGLNPMLYKLNMAPRLHKKLNARLVVPTFLYPDFLHYAQNKRNESILSFAERYNTKYSIRVSAYPFYARDALKLIEQVLQAIGSENPKRIRDQIAKRETFDGLVGRYDFSRDNHSGLCPNVFRAEAQKDDGCDPGLYPCRSNCETTCCKEDGC